MVMSENDMQPYERYNSLMLFDYLEDAKPSVKNISSYSNLGMALAGVLAEIISHKSYAELLDEYIFIPFRILTPDKAIANTFNSDGYFVNTQKIKYWNWDVMAPAGGLKCSAEELLTYLSNMSKPADNSSAKIIDTLLSPTATLSPVLKIGRGWHIYGQKNKPDVYWHNGGTFGFSTFAAFLKDTDQAVVVVINKFNSNAAADKLGLSIMKKLME
jgi:CubicO group peptidase (beta-lactamase class C family)